MNGVRDLEAPVSRIIGAKAEAQTGSEVEVETTEVVTPLGEVTVVGATVVVVVKALNQ